ncbi:two-component system, OmpR family, osmolarity sensor histidine kinase EnvZ [Pseudorhodobacter antarcticus]|uniref:histidine kinase n=1 Tax=Pseudorhodobacter antarcticus TaxID=1077947 RepID=A0A1H8D1X1_9RHOB|nr:ATP-binding protein [Pseudorhodobacter antarcticus]SEN01293.1 two-component system, OmpR family, osmolarity sensor histidine kinase EnvZ [Pseudorhodobacter antarcticus]
MFGKVKNIFPRGLYGRAASILIVPIVTIQLVVSVAFIQRHFEGVTRQMTMGVATELAYLLAQWEGADASAAQGRLREIASGLGMAVTVPAPVTDGADLRELLDLSGAEVIANLRAAVPGIAHVALLSSPQRVEMTIDTARGPILVVVNRSRVSASNPHQLLVLMILTSIFMTLIAYGFLRNQLRPITLLSDAATAFGKGQHVAYRPRGALEVRAAGKAFLDMRARIERQIEQRTMMLSGISHDLRTPLTRLRLGLSLLPEDEETAALLGDVGDMQRLIDEFLSFARGDAMEEAEVVNPRELVGRIVDNAARAGSPVTLGRIAVAAEVMMRPAAVTRALENLIGNAARFGTCVRVSALQTGRNLRVMVEDDGPGIAPDQREEAMMPFARLDAARDPNKGGGVGLGLAIAQDVARSHGGRLILSRSEDLGGLKAEFMIAC